MRATMKMPAVTMVAAWISAEIGVGPSMESGSQTCSGICADLPMAPTNRQMQITVSADQPVALEQHRRSWRRCAGAAANASLVVERAGVVQHPGDAEHEAEVADPIDQEGLEAGEDRGRPRVPEADQQVGHQRRPLPSRRTAA